MGWDIYKLGSGHCVDQFVSCLLEISTRVDSLNCVDGVEEKNAGLC